jgi:hypothetical protein
LHVGQKRGWRSLVLQTLCNWWSPIRELRAAGYNLTGIEINPKVMKPFQADDAIGFQTSSAIYPYTDFAAARPSGEACSHQ